MRSFGGPWTQQKLIVLKKYLCAYLTILSKKSYKTIYIDAFAGQGYIGNKIQQQKFFEDQEIEEFTKGSVYISLELEPCFDQYIFIENNKKCLAELQDIKEQFTSRQIEILSGDANQKLRDLCDQIDWYTSRAIIFLDPFGMEVYWETLEKIARTKAVDIWILAPLGLLNRLLPNKEYPNEQNIKKLDSFFGTYEWQLKFYQRNLPYNSLVSTPQIAKKANFDTIVEYYCLDRLKQILAVCERPLFLYNSKRNPIYFLCFAAANQKTANISMKIAQDIIYKEWTRDQRTFF